MSEDPSPPTKPFLKWAGNKFRVIGEVTKAIQDRKEDRSAYFEPFGGSGAIIANVGELFDSRTYGEFNPELVHLMQAMRDNLPTLLKETEKLFDPENNVGDNYYKIREKFNLSISSANSDLVLKSAQFIYLNRHCFNGLCRYGPNGFNVPFGRYAKTSAPLDEMKAFAKKMKGVKIPQASSFKTLMAKADKNTLVYCDPPYFPLTETSNFTQYSSKAGFNEEMQEELANVAAECAKRGAVVLISNHDVPACHELYKKTAKRHGIKVDLGHTFLVSRFISSKGKDRGNKAGELIAVFEAKEVK